MPEPEAAELLTAKIIGKQTRLALEEVRALFRRGKSKNPEFALEKGLIQKICEAEIEPGAPIHSIVAGA